MLGTRRGKGATKAIVNRILLIDANPESAAELKSLLQAAGCDVDVAKDGGQAQSMFVMRKPDLVIAEVILPNETGFEVCERFKTTDSTVPVMFVSEVEIDDALRLAKRVGADDYVIKPFHPDDLIDRIQLVADTVWQKNHGQMPASVGSDGRIHFSCRCGKKLKVSETHRGRALTCPECGEVITVPRV